MALKLRALKAKHGDSLILFCDDTVVLIDGGPSGVYNSVLRDELKQLPADPDPGEPRRVDLMMVSHIDDDHINGILELTDELIEARDDQREPLVRIDRAWHNSFSDLIADAQPASDNVSTSAASTASALEELLPQVSVTADGAFVLASVGQGRRLRRDLKTLNVDTNLRFQDRTVLQGNAGPWVKGALALTVIGPTQDELDDLRVRWKRDLKKILKKEADAAVAAAALDRSVSNLASIVVLAESAGKTILLTGDARGDMILDWLEKGQFVDPGGVFEVDVLKLPHHGSDRNVTPEFFERVRANHYVVSGDGGHGNPEPKMLEMLFDARPALDYTVHMTYGPDELKQHPKFIKEGNPADLDALLTDDRRAILRFPAAEATCIDIEP